MVELAQSADQAGLSPYCLSELYGVVTNAGTTPGTLLWPPWRQELPTCASGLRAGLLLNRRPGAETF